MAMTVTLMTVKEYLAAHGEFGPVCADNVGRRARQISNAAYLTLRRQGDDVLMTETALLMAANAEWQIDLSRAGKHHGTLAKPFKGITKFARKHGYSRQHALEVLKGIRTSAPLLRDWARWQAARKAEAKQVGSKR